MKAVPSSHPFRSAARRALVPAFLAVAVSFSAALADTVTLKTGEVIQGTILSEDEKGIVIEALVSAGISENRTYEKAAVAKVVQTPKDELAWQKLANCKPGPRSFVVAAYPRLTALLEQFARDFPKSPHAREAGEIAAELKKEQARVQAGDLKWDNRWYSPREVEANKAQLQAQMALATLRELAQRGDFVSGLMLFERIEALYPGSVAYPDAVDLAKAMVRAGRADIDRQASMAGAQQAQFDEKIILVLEPEKTQVLAARAAQTEAALNAIKAATGKWKPLQPLVPKSYEEFKATLNSEGVRIEKISVAPLRLSIAAANRAEKELEVKNLEGATDSIAEARRLWDQNEQLAGLDKGLAVLKEFLKPKPTPQPTATPKPTPPPKSTPEPTATPEPTKKSLLQNLFS